jgi:signal transduction histidine kinase
MEHVILCVDDEIYNLDALERLFRKDYKVLKASSGDEGLALLKDHSVALIISDQRMPKMQGTEFLRRSMRLQPDAIRILLTGYTDIESVIEAINAGEVYKYVTKPWDAVDFKNTVQKGIEKYELRRSLETKNRELEAAYRELSSLDEAKTHFMVLINHELKTPLTAMLSFLGLLKETRLDGDQAKYVGRIEQSAERIARLVEDSLELMRAETGQLKVQARGVRVRPLLEELRFNAERLQKRGLKITRQAIDETLLIDKRVVQNVLERLLDNAIKFAKEGTTIEVQIEKRGAAAEFSVRNAGPTLSLARIDKILKPFTVDEDILHHGEGTGLGLSLSQALLKAHQSGLSVQSQDGFVRFSFRI